MNFGQIWLAKDAGCLAGSQGFCKAKVAEIQPSGGAVGFRGTLKREMEKNLHFVQDDTLRNGVVPGGTRDLLGSCRAAAAGASAAHNNPQFMDIPPPPMYNTPRR